ncbi:MAG: photosystem I reaction center subunit PsaK [Rhizonema sp. NSF051]|nr:photosystem I reaction center subunit PsaK [Rhizonema sp. NSF051]
MISSMLLAVQVTVPNTGTEWDWTGTPVIIVACLLALLIIPRIIRYPHVGIKMPLPFPEIFNNPSVGTFLAAMSTGHLIGIGIVLGLNNLNAL